MLRDVDGRPFAPSWTNEQTSFDSYEDERTSRRANYDFLRRSWLPTFALAWALRRPLSKTETERGLRLELRGRRLGQKEKLARGRERRENEGGATFVARRKRGPKRTTAQKTIIVFFLQGEGGVSRGEERKKGKEKWKKRRKENNRSGEQLHHFSLLTQFALARVIRAIGLFGLG